MIINVECDNNEMSQKNCLLTSLTINSLSLRSSLVSRRDQQRENIIEAFQCLILFDFSILSLYKRGLITLNQLLKKTPEVVPKVVSWDFLMILYLVCPLTNTLLIQSRNLSLYNSTSVCIFSIHFLRCWQGVFV